MTNVKPTAKPGPDTKKITRGSQPDTYRLFNGIKETNDQNRNLRRANHQRSNWKLHEL